MQQACIGEGEGEEEGGKEAEKEIVGGAMA